ncbi:MAG TPA: Dabb family protein, partial [Candidatus Ignatzschineria merdigallinarum]|nr:Dabb family protein [Candidatus Ignatzschineria merdigallinarum]
MIKHIVLVRFKKEINTSQIQQIFEKIGNLESILPSMKSFDYGKYNGSIERHKGFDYAFYMT